MLISQLGGGCEKTSLTEHEKILCSELKSRLEQLCIYITGIDVIGGYLTEINITSPTCLEEIHNFDASNPAKQIIEWAENYDLLNK